MIECVTHNGIYGHEGARKGRRFRIHPLMGSARRGLRSHALFGRRKTGSSSKLAIYKHIGGRKGRTIRNHAACGRGKLKKDAVYRNVCTGQSALVFLRLANASMISGQFLSFENTQTSFVHLLLEVKVIPTRTRISRLYTIYKIINESSP